MTATQTPSSSQTGAALDAVRSRIIDLDSHLMLFPEEVLDLFGMPEAMRKAGASRFTAKEGEEDGFFTDRTLGNPEVLASTRAKARADIWNVKGWGAHGAQLVDDRVDCLDQMGVRRQLVFPTGMWPAMHSDQDWGFNAVTRYNDYVLDWSVGPTAERVVPACLINNHDLDRAMAEVDRVLGRGAQLIQFACNEPWAGMSPAAPEWEPLWARLAAAGVAALFHLGSEGGGAKAKKFVSNRWAKGAPNQFFPPRADSDPGEVFGPFHMTTIHMAPETALSTMIFGGVFERHPDLRFGVIEMGANWVEGWCERLDTTADTFARQLSGQLSLRPSEYVRRQIRVTPYYHEPVGRWLERSPELADVYVFSTDFPHPEGGKDPIDKFMAQIAPLGPDMVERFFVTNGQLLLP